MSVGNGSTEAEELGRLLTRDGLQLAVMESCSGGQLADRLTSLPGCGAYFVGGVVAYDTVVKNAMGVPGEVVEEFG
jgi:nicotinamide-nucleotide amidase